MELTFLGTGTSVGVPVIGCECEVCTSNNPKNTRTRSSVYIEYEDRSFVIDTSVDFRQQMLREDINHLDFILFTHAHADHIMGLDDVRPLNSLHGESLDCYGQPETLEVIRDTFDYIFKETPNESWKPEIELFPIESKQTIDGVPVEPLPVKHGNIGIYGYRIGRLAYISDVSHIPDDTLGLLDNLEVLVLDALRDKNHPTHFTIEQAIDTARKIDADRTYFTHMTHDHGHEALTERVPPTIQPAHDGLTLTIDH